MELTQVERHKGGGTIVKAQAGYWRTLYVNASVTSLPAMFTHMYETYIAPKTELAEFDQTWTYGLWMADDLAETVERVFRDTFPTAEVTTEPRSY